MGFGLSKVCMFYFICVYVFIYLLASPTISLTVYCNA